MPWTAESPLSGALGFLGSYLQNKRALADQQAQRDQDARQQAFQNSIATKDLGIRSSDLALRAAHDKTDFGLRREELTNTEAATKRINSLADAGTARTRANQMLSDRLAQLTQGLSAAAQQASAAGKYDEATFAQAVGRVAYSLVGRIKAEHPGVTDADLDVPAAIGAIVTPMTAMAQTAEKNRQARYENTTRRISAQKQPAGAALDAAKLQFLQSHGYLPGSGPPRARAGNANAVIDPRFEAWSSAIRASGNPKAAAAAAVSAALAAGANNRTVEALRAIGDEGAALQPNSQKPGYYWDSGTQSWVYRTAMPKSPPPPQPQP